MPKRNRTRAHARAWVRDAKTLARASRGAWVPFVLAALCIGTGHSMWAIGCALVGLAVLWLRP